MAKIQKLDRATLTDEIVGDLRQKIITGEFEVGAKLPNETHLAASYGVGRGTVREAIKALSLMRLLKRSTAGTYVAPGARVHVPDELLVSIRTSDPDFSSLYDARIVLSKRVVQLAAERATQDDLDKLFTAISRAEASSSELTALEADLEYHYALAEAAHSPVVTYLYMVTTDAIARVYKLFLHIYEGGAAWGPENHRKVAEAIANKDSTEAERITVESLERAAKEIQQTASDRQRDN